MRKVGHVSAVGLAFYK